MIKIMAPNVYLKNLIFNKQGLQKVCFYFHLVFLPVFIWNKAVICQRKSSGLFLEQEMKSGSETDSGAREHHGSSGSGAPSAGENRD